MWPWTKIAKLEGRCADLEFQVDRLHERVASLASRDITPRIRAKNAPPWLGGAHDPKWLISHTAVIDKILDHIGLEIVGPDEHGVKIIARVGK